MKKTRHLLLTLFLVLTMVFGLCAPTVAFALSSDPDTAENNPSERPTEGGSLDLKWFVLEYDKDNITITVRPDVRSLLDTDKADLDELISSLIDAVMFVVSEDIKQGFIDDQYGEDGGVSVEGININNVWKTAMDNYIATLGDDVLTLDSDPYVALFKAAVKDDGNTIIADYINYACTLVKFACKAGYISVEELDSHTDDEYRARVDEIVKTEIEAALKSRVSTYADAYVTWLVDNVPHGLDPEVERIINDAVVDYVIDLRDRYIAETLDLSNVAELAFYEYVYAEFNHEAEAKYSELLDEEIWKQVKALPYYDESLSDSDKAALYDQVKDAYVNSPDFAADHDAFMAEAWEHKGEIIEDAVRIDNAIDYLHTVLHSYKLTHPDYFEGVEDAIIEIARNTTSLDMSKPPVDGDIRDEAFKITLGIGHAEFYEKLDGYIDELLVSLRLTVDEVRGIDTELGFKDAFEILNYVTVNGEEIFGLGDDGVNTFKMDAIKALIKELPTPAEIKDFTLDEMALTFDVILGTTVGKSSFALTLKVGSGDDKVRALARLIDEYLEFSVDGTTVNVSLTVPERVSELLLDACNSDKISDDLKLKIFSLLDSTVDDLYNRISEFTFDEIKDILTSDSFDFVRNSDFINQYIDLKSLSDDEIIAKLDELEPIFDKAMGYLEPLYSYVPDSIKSKTVFDLYDAEGNFSASGTATVTIEHVERILEKLSSEYGLLISSYVPEFEKTVTVNAKVSFTGVYMVQYVIGADTVRGFLPAGADLAHFANTTEIDGVKIVAWADEGGNEITDMPARDVILTPVFEDLTPDLPTEIKWDYTAPFTADGTDKTVALLTDGINLNYYKIVYEGTVSGSSVGKYTAVAKIVLISTGEVKRTLSLDWDIVSPDLPTEIEWDYTKKFIEDGAQKTVALVTTGINLNYYKVVYEGVTSEAVSGEYTATAKVVEIATGEVKMTSTLTWNIVAPVGDDLEWTGDAYYVYTGDEFTVTLKPGQFDEKFFEARNYKLNSASAVGTYTASVDIYDIEENTLVKTVTHEWQIVPTIKAEWDFDYDFFFDGTEKTVLLKTGDGFIDLDYYKVEYRNNAFTALGTYKATATVTVLFTNEVVETVELDWAIIPDVSALKWNYTGAFIYDGNEKSVALDTSSLGAEFDSIYRVEYTDAAKTEVGTYTATARIVVIANDAILGERTVTWQILAGIPTDILWDENPTYDGGEHTVNIKDGQINLDCYTVTVTDNKGTNAGDYTAKIVITNTLTGDTVYEGTHAWSIAPFELDLSLFTWNYTSEFVYTGSDYTVTVGGYPALFNPEWLVYENNSAKNAGTYYAKAKIDEEKLGDNFTVKADTEISTLTWKIAKANIDMSGVRFDSATFVYNGDEHFLYVTGLPEGVTVSYEGNNRTNAGVYTVTARFSAVDYKNYNHPASITATITILSTSSAYPEGSDDPYIKIDAPDGIDPEIDVVINSVIQNFIDGVTVNGEHREVISAYDVSFFKNMAEQEMSGTFTVRLRIPDRYLEREDLIVVHIADDGTTTVVESQRDGEYMVFDALHFSVYAITVTGEEEIFEAKSNLWLIILIAVLVALLVLIVIIVIIKLKKKGTDGTDDTTPTEPETEPEDSASEPEATEPVAEPEAEPEVVPEPVAEPEIEPEVVPEPVAEPEIEPEVVPEPVAEPEIEPEVVPEPVAEPETEPEVVPEPVVEPAPAPVVAEPVIIPVTNDGADGLQAVIDGEVVMVRYRSSFQSRLIQSDADIQSYYTVLKNKLLSYKGVKARTSWNFESFNKARVQCAKLNIKGKAILLYINLDTEQYSATKYHFQDVSDKPKFSDVPMMLKVKSDRALKYALELIDELMTKLEIPAAATSKEVDYRMPYETTEELAKRGLVKIILPKGMQLDENMNLIKMNVSELIDGKAKADATPEKVEEPATEPVVEEPVAAEPVVEEPVVVEHAHVKPEEVVHVDALQADEMIVDSEAVLAIEHIHTDVAKRKGRFAEVNLDVICENFENGETVTVRALIERRVVSKNTARVKILARGVMTKALTIVASKFSLQAVKMITLAGGSAEIEE